ncbi:MAG: hypothetical protein P4L51_18580 [Puia sp.]|nr:hypothetical protein [Puia sp.]
MQRHAWIGVHSGALGAGVGVILAIYLAFSQRVFRFFRQFIVECGKIAVVMTRTFFDASVTERSLIVLLFAGVIVYRLYFFFAFPLHTDELCSYLYFAKQGFFMTITNYVLPNNHVLYNVACSFLSAVGVFSPKAVMRLPSMAGDLLMLYGIFCFIRQRAPLSRALGVIAGVAFCYLPSFYAVQGRGYQWQECCVIVNCVACWSCYFRSNGGARKGYALFALSGVAGLYLNPLFCYHFLAILFLGTGFLAWKRDFAGMRSFLGCYGLITGGVFVLYLPILLCNGLQALTANTWLTGESSVGRLLADYSSVAFSLKYLSYYGEPGMYLLLGGAALSFALYCKRVIRGEFYDDALLYFVAITVSIAILTLFKKAYPPERSLCFWILSLNLVFVNICYDLASKFLGNKWPAFLTIFLVLKIAGSVRGLYWERFAVAEQPYVKIYYGLQKDFRALSAYRPATWLITDSDDFYSMYLRLYLLDKASGRADGGEEASNVVFGRKGASGDVLFLPDCYLPYFSLGEYRLWAEHRISAKCNGNETLSVYISKRLVSVSGEKPLRGVSDF